MMNDKYSQSNEINDFHNFEDSPSFLDFKIFAATFSYQD